MNQLHRLCSVCYRPGHTSSDCPASICTLCNMPGHRVSVCPDNNTKSLVAKVAALERGYRCIQSAVQHDPEMKRLSDALFMERAIRLLYRSIQEIHPFLTRRVSQVIAAMATPSPADVPNRPFFAQAPRPPVILSEMTCSQVMKHKKISHTIHLVKPGIECNICYNIENAYVKFNCGHSMCVKCAKPYVISNHAPTCHMCRVSLSV